MSILLVMLTSAVYAQGEKKLIRIDATRYEMRISNRFQHTLRVVVKDRETNKIEDFVLTPGEIKNFEGVFNKKKLQDLEVFCMYDYATFRNDLERFQSSILSKNYSQQSKIKSEDWYRFVTDFVANKSVTDYLRDFDFDQPALNGSSAEEVAQNITDRILKDQSYLSAFKSNVFASNSPSTARAAVAAVLELAFQASEYGYTTKIKHLRSMLVTLSDGELVSKSRNLIYNVADGLDLRTFTPLHFVRFTPIIFTENLNEFWLAPNEVGLDVEKVLSEGWFNNTLSLQFGRGISPEVRLGNRHLHARVYGTLFYERISYRLNDFGLYYVSEDYVDLKENVPDPDQDISNAEDIHLELSSFGASAIGKVLIGKFLFVDVEGGLLTRQGRLNFRQGDEHFETNINVNALTHERRTPVLKRSFAPFAKVKVGGGYIPNKGNGLFFSVGFSVTQSALETNDNYGLFTKTPANTQMVGVESNTWLYGVTFGLDYMF